MTRPVRTAVFPVAGRGTRFLPVTKANPKEMLPIVDKPLIQYAVEEAIAAGATKLVFVTGASKRAIEDHFDTDAELEQALMNAGKDELLASIRDIVPANVTCVYIRQGEPLGLGHSGRRVRDGQFAARRSALDGGQWCCRRTQSGRRCPVCRRDAAARGDSRTQLE